MKTFNFNNLFNYNKQPIIISEISGNHNGSKQKFLKLIRLACKNGADLIKIQTYEPKDITLNKNSKHFQIKKGLWKNKKLWDLYNEAHTPFAWHKEAFDIAKKNKKILFSSPFSLRAVDMLEKLGCKIYKIASFEITDFKLINYIASKNKPIIISTGMANLDEVKKAIKIIEKYHSKIIIMHCVSSYPTEIKNMNLKRIDHLKKIFSKYLIGISDHTKSIHSSIAATAKGVVAIEKHLKMNDKLVTTDSSFSITPDELRELKNLTNDIFKALNDSKNNGEKYNKKLRRSIFASKQIKKNQKLTKYNIETFRPLIGICASKYFKILGKKTNKIIKKNEPIFDKDLL